MREEAVPREQGAGVEGSIDRWRVQRGALLRQLQSAQAHAGARGRPTVLESGIRRLRQCLMDYLCAGHFTVYARLDPDGRSRRLPLLHRLLQCIDSSTDLALQFHDKYDTDLASLLAERALPGDLAQLRRVLLIRFELEEQLLDLLVEGAGTPAP